MAYAIAVGADAIQLALFPFFAEGYASPMNDALDVLVAILLLATVGFHWVLLPSIVLEQLPMVDLAPTWTIAVTIICRTKSRELQAAPGHP